MEVQASDELIIERGLYDLIDTELYSNTDAPVSMRIGLESDSPIFTPKIDSCMPPEVIGVPRELMRELDLGSHDRVSIFILNPKQSVLFNNSMKLGSLPERE